jgi:hypothetical protein
MREAGYANTRGQDCASRRPQRRIVSPYSSHRPVFPQDKAVRMLSIKNNLNGLREPAFIQKKHFAANDELPNIERGTKNVSPPRRGAARVADLNGA